MIKREKNEADRKKSRNECSSVLKNGAEFKDAIDTIITDPYGSWTVVPRIEGEIPVQDVDDL
jgi:hypothetical protein